MRQSLHLLFTGLLALLLTGCEKNLLDEAQDGTEDLGSANVILHVTAYEQTPFGTRSPQDVTQLCTRLNFGIFQDGTKVKTISQKQDDASFGTVGLTLAEGNYQLVIIAHNSTGSATISTTEKVTFPSNLISDTFYYYGQLTVNDTQETYDLELTRSVAMFRLQLTQPLPATVAKMRFYYTGGSSTFSPLAGYGCVNSRQTVVQTVESGQTTFDIYTFPHADSDVLKIVVTAYDAADNILHERTFEEVPVTVNEITRYTGDFFGTGGGGSQASDGTFRLTAEAEWGTEKNYNF